MNTKKSLTFKFLKRIYLENLSNLSDSGRLFIYVLVFYLLLFGINAPNKLILAAFIPLYLLINRLTHDFRKSLFLTFISSVIIGVGKTYYVQLVPIGVYDPTIYPSGYMVNLVITPSVVISSIMLIVLIRDIVISKHIKPLLNKLNLMLLIFFLFTLFTDVFISRNPAISLSLNLIGQSGLISYYYLQYYVNKPEEYLRLLVPVFFSLLVFCSIVACYQFITKSPIGSSLETTQNYETYGSASDEINFTYRPASIFNHAMTLGTIISYWLILAMVAYLKNPSTKYLFLLVLGFVVLILTLARSAWLAFIIGVLTVLFIFEKIKKMTITDRINTKVLPAVLMLILLLIPVIMPRLINSINTFSDGGGNFRLKQIEAAANIIKIKPIFGVGSGMTVPEGLEHFPDSIFGDEALEIHNWYFFTMASNGVIAPTIYLFFIILSTKYIYSKIIKTHTAKYLDFFGVGLIGVVIVQLTIGFFSSNIVDIYVLTLLGIYNNNV